MAIKAKQPQDKIKSSKPKKVNILTPPQLTKEEKERLEAQFEIVRPQIARVHELINSPFIEYQENLNRMLKELTVPVLMPSLVIAEQMSGINNIFKDALRIHEMQRELIEQSLAPMREFQDSIKQATRLYQEMFTGFSSPLNILSGLVVNVTLSDHIEKLSQQARTVYDYDEANSTFDFETNELSTSAKVSTEVETKTILYKHTRNVNFKLGIFEHDLASFGLKLERIEANQEVMIANQEKIISYLMDGTKRTVTANDLKIDEELLDLTFCGKPIGLGSSTNMRMVAGVLFSPKKKYGDWWTMDEIESALNYEIKEDAIMVARRHLNTKLEKIISAKHSEKVIELDNLKMRINPIYLA
jgi:hypothetical protein